ncbi:hypothetical protein EMIHUDRAFT_232732 [Emiliania huxleyi CCMP1516]|uniref:CUB domain-containing protein n=2 Tax=Emiliania huxleyi TaxID=2903 RepID=A0A0D3K473_EMIH1|nr:hypothetical protein EMIHUDRAFT_232732 [Emiliania huxleyi CCMP1516]EOD30558.1 hypothetical protein EMIHUDRAFT_232732 [Emiliania huxleyi CCMP1516]|eukprot:XP_005782987.1 hypothetical protein EMIHUDRAFT_232732 [Emiliania huxleyi CCMP1516]
MLVLALALLATPSTAASRPRPRRGGALIDTRNRTDFSIKLETDAPSLALAASASRKPNKAAGLLLLQYVLGGGWALLGACPDVATIHPAVSFPFNLSKFSGAASRAAAPTTLKPIGAAADAELASFGEVAGAVKNGDVSLADSTANSVGVTCGSGGAPVWCAEPPQPLTELCVSEDPIEASGFTSNETVCTTATAHSKGEADETDTKADCTTATAHSNVEIGIGKTYPTTSTLNIGAYAELAPPLFDETSGATKIGDPSLEESFTNATALSEIDAASLLFLRSCAAVLALLLAACLEPPLREKRVERSSHAAISPGVNCVDGPCSLTDGGSCAASPNYPNSYGDSEECTISGVPPVELETVAFDVEAGNGCPYDYLTVNGTKYCGTSGPSGAVAEDGVIKWRSDDVVICWATRPPPPPYPSQMAPTPPPPLLPGGYFITGPCSLTDGGSCAASPNYPNSYGNNEACTISGVPTVGLELIGFDVEAGDGCPFDYLTVNGTKYCGTSGPSGAVAEDGVIEWRSDYSVVGSGWKARACEAELRSLITEAAASQANVSIYLPPGDVEIIESVVRDCSATYNGGVVRALRSGAVSITSSSVSGCSAGNHGGVVHAYDSGAVSINGSAVSSCSAYVGGVVRAISSGAVSITSSDVSGCSADYVRRVELAALLQHRTAAG